jgi:DNA-directed RNA polymerase specialized sigma24 family protein
MKLNIEGLRSNEPKQAAELHALCKHIAEVSTGRVGLRGEYAQDLASELMLLVIERLPEIYDGTSDIDGFIWEAARRKTMSYSRRARREFSAYQGDDGEEGGSLLDALPDENTELADAWTQDRITAEQARDARSRLIQRMREVMGTPKMAAPKPAVAVPAAPAPVDAGEDEGVEPSSKRAKQWKERRQLGWTQSQMARELGLSLSQFRRMERSGPMPARLRPQVEALLKKAAVTLPTEGAERLLKRWAELLGIGADDVGGLSRMLGVHRTTIFRWRKGQAEPQGPAVLAIEARIAALMEVRRRQGRGGA